MSDEERAAGEVRPAESREAETHDDTATQASDGDVDEPIENVIAELDALIADDVAAGAPGTEPIAEPVVPRLWPVVIEALQQLGWQYDSNDVDGAWFGVVGDTMRFDCCIRVDERTDVVRYWITMPVRVPERRRRAVTDLIGRLNADVVLHGHVVLVSDGHPQWRQTVDVEGGVLGVPMVVNTIRSGLWYCDRVVPALMAATFARAPAVAAMAFVAEA